MGKRYEELEARVAQNERNIQYLTGRVKAALDAVCDALGQEPDTVKSDIKYLEERVKSLEPLLFLAEAVSRREEWLEDHESYER